MIRVVIRDEDTHKEGAEEIRESIQGPSIIPRHDRPKQPATLKSGKLRGLHPISASLDSSKQEDEDGNGPKLTM